MNSDEVDASPASGELPVVLSRELVARALLTLGALVPYWKLLSFAVIPITDDLMYSDVYHGELPGRILMGRALAQGQLPVWTSEICSGFPLAGFEPISAALFALLPPAEAVCALYLVLLLVAAHGAYGLARRVGASLAGAVLAGIAFAGCGYFAAQLKHIAIVATVAWTPLALLLLDRALVFAPFAAPPAAADDRNPPLTAPDSVAPRVVSFALFGLVFAEQWLCGFPQSAYIATLAYALWGGLRLALSAESWRTRLAAAGGAALAGSLGIAGGALSLLPLAELGSLSDRATGLSYEWATRLAYWPPNALNFLIPYYHGDVSDASYSGARLSLFWEDYGYLGLAPVLLTVYALVRGFRRREVWLILGLTFAAYVMVLGRATPAFWVAFELVPGMNRFRFPTRFLFLVELGLAVLGGLGLTRLEQDSGALTAPWTKSVTTYLAPVVVALTVADLLVHQPRQNPLVVAHEWLAPPATATHLRRTAPEARIYTPNHRELHKAAFRAARGWANVRPYFAFRELLQPNSNVYWGLRSADGYVGIAPRWYVDVWGDHNRPSSLAVQDTGPHTWRLLGSYGVTHVLAPGPTGVQLRTIPGASRARVVREAMGVGDQAALVELTRPDFDPTRAVLLHDAPESIAPRGRRPPVATPAGSAEVVRDRGAELVVRAHAPQGGFLVVADTFYPGWEATVSGQPAPIYRANVSLRAIALPPGDHEVVMRFRAGRWWRGLMISSVVWVLLLGTAAVASTLPLWRRRPHGTSNAPHGAEGRP